MAISMKVFIKSQRCIVVGAKVDKLGIDRGAGPGIGVSEVGKLEIELALLKAALSGVVAPFGAESLSKSLKAAKPY